MVLTDSRSNWLSVEMRMGMMPEEAVPEAGDWRSFLGRVSAEKRKNKHELSLTNY